MNEQPEFVVVPSTSASTSSPSASAVSITSCACSKWTLRRNYRIITPESGTLCGRHHAESSPFDRCYSHAHPRLRRYANNMECPDPDPHSRMIFYSSLVHTPHSKHHHHYRYHHTGPITKTFESAEAHRTTAIPKFSLLFMWVVFLLLLDIFGPLTTTTTTTTITMVSAESTPAIDPAIMAVFRDVHDGREVELEKMIMDRSTNRLYVGGVDHLYDISPDALAIREHAITGPRPDSLLCADALSGVCKEQLVSTHSYTKALAIFPSLNKLIECTSLYQGRCRTRNLSNIRREADIRSSRPGIVANDQPSSTVIFVGSGPTAGQPVSALSADDDASEPSSAKTSIVTPPRVMYVASTYVPAVIGPRDALDVPAVASLSLEAGSRLFEFTSQSISSGTFMKLDYRRMPNFRIDYVGGFEANGFAYFATRQPKYAPAAEPQPQISKLVRVCTQDPNFYSYTEAPLECLRNGVNYNLLQDLHVGNPGFDLAVSLRVKPTDLVMFGVFSRGDGAERNVTSRDSALCVFPLRQIEKKFFENIRVCYNGATRTNLPWFNSDKMCTTTRYPDSEIMCGKDVNSYIGGEIPIVAMASLVDRTSLFTSITFNSVQSATVAFIGTASGVLHKALIEGHDGLSVIYKSIQLTVDGSPLLQDMELDEKNGLLYAMSRHALYKVNVRLCSQSADCNACMEAGDPYCGWCMKPSACTTQDVCDADAIDPKADWLNYKSGRCPLIEGIEPSEQQITSARTLSVSIKNVPPKVSDLYCSFLFPNQQRVNVSATIKESGISCATPARSGLRSVGGGGSAVSVTARLFVLKADDNSVIASSNFTFYDCHQLRKCSACASSAFPCDWCTMSGRCVPNAEDVCQGETLVNAISRLGPSSRRGPEFCPRFTALPSTFTGDGTSPTLSSTSADIFVASGRKRRVIVQAHNLHEQMTNFKCQYTVEQEQMTHEKLAHRKGDRIICEDILFEYANVGGTLGNGTAVARFDIVWSPSSGSASAMSSSSSGASSERVLATTANVPQHRLDNSDEMRVVIYKCEQLALNCGLCLGLDSRRFECGWCDADTRCTHADACATTSAWLTRIASSGVVGGSPICPLPRIDDFTPKKGPINGGTKITITGVNLGLSYADVRDALRVASAKCDVSEREYVPSVRIVCYTRAPSTRQKQGQHVVFKLRDDRRYTAASAQTFTYADPTITSFQPYRGPRSGGTDITVLGSDLDSGAMFNLSIGQAPCVIQSRTSSMVVCRTGPAPAERPEFLTLSADGTQVKVENVQFQFTANPTVDRVQRALSIVSGGIAVDVLGKGFDLLQRARMVVYHEGSLYYGARCETVDENLMVCRTPALDDLSAERRRAFTPERPLRVDYGFDLDGQLTGNLTTERSFSKLIVYDDPVINKFAERQTIRIGGDLVLKGANLNLAAAQRDIGVTVDGRACNVTALAPSTLTCVLPTDLGDDVFDVVIYVGGKVEKVGEVSHNAPNEASTFLIAALVIASLAVGLALLLIVLYRRKSTSYNRQMRYLKNQMNTIEMKVAQECKEAFHELQTNINALAGSVPQGTSFIPFLSYPEYATRILFPHAHANHPVLRELTIEQDRAHAVESGLRQLHRLLQNRTFLLLFVRCIDENKYLLLKDRVYVGSLLMVILQERMEYCTDILKQLLKELIRRNVDSKFQPKILFRRAESVAERMLSAWFSFLMYRFLRRCAGKPLYQLYWATKQQTEKGPQDALTMDARYSLSEEKLLRATFDFRELTVFVVNDAAPPTNYETQVRVLDCDSISQVKERCLDAVYRTTPFSERPAPVDVDLELRTPRHRILLQDLDATSKCDNGCWRYNTLIHYKVDDKATLALLPRHLAVATGTTNTSSSYNLSLISDRSERSTGSGGGGGNGNGNAGGPLISGSMAMIGTGSMAGSAFHNGSFVGAPPMPSSMGSPKAALFDGLPGIGGGGGHHNHHHGKDSHHSLRVYHLVRQAVDHHHHHGGSMHDGGQDKMVTEIYLTRLLTMKGTLQKFIEEMLEIIFSTVNGVSPMPPCIKYMFDFLDDQAREHGILDPEVVHAWKSNALPLRFWVNLLKNPDFIFDIQKPTKIEGSLNVVAQTLMDACSTQENHLTKDSPSSKLLFANEIDKYKSWVHRYYAEVQQMPPIVEHEMGMLLAEESREHGDDFLVFSALNELYVYVSQNREMIFEELSQNEFALQQQLPEKFQKMLDTMEVAPVATDALIVNGGGGGTLDNYNSKSRLMSNNSRFY